MSNPVHRLPLRVYYADSDAGGVLYHARYIEFFERARWEAFIAKGLSIPDLANEGTLFAVAEINIRYRKPARLGDAVVVETDLPEFGRASLTVPQKLVLESDRTLLAEAQVRVVCIGKDFKPKSIPQLVLDRLKS